MTKTMERWVAGTLVVTFGPDSESDPGVVVEAPNRNGLCKVLFLDGAVRVRHVSKLSLRNEAP